ncbi:MAG: hypothetical protein WBY94_29560 [Polyangiaceae bacterium]
MNSKMKWFASSFFAAATALGCNGGSSGGALEESVGFVGHAGGGTPSDASSSGAGSRASGSGDSASGVPSGDGSVAEGSANQGAPEAGAAAMDTPASDASMVEPSCAPNTTWSAPVAVPGVPSFATEPIVTLTGDELTLAWVLDAGGGQGSVFVADRASPSDPFADALPFVADAPADAGTSSYFAFERVAVAGDGLTLSGVANGGQAMGDFTRTARGQTFSGTPLEYVFQPIVTQLAGDFRGGSLGDPVVTPDGTDLVYSVAGLSGSTSVFESRTTTQIWTNGSPQASTPLQSANGARKRPTSITADHLNLFYWDDGAGTAYVVQRGFPTANFNFSWSLGAYASVQTNSRCTRLYYVTAASGGGYELVSIDAQ